MSAIRNIIFDLGGVIINLDTPATIKAFEALGASNFSGVYNQLQQTPIFDLYDKGLVSDADFRRELKTLTGLQLSDTDFDTAWNAMLLDFPKHRLQLLAAIKSKYRTFLLSNTNHVHVAAFEAGLLKNHGMPNLSSLFEKTYYSCQIGLRKPDREIFDFVLKENKLDPAETLFIDDSPQHVEGAKQAGIHAILLGKGEEVGDVLSKMRLL
jgi:FMN phosphatase YigB (HAD superfamily)